VIRGTDGGKCGEFAVLGVRCHVCGVGWLGRGEWCARITLHKNFVIMLFYFLIEGPYCHSDCHNYCIHYHIIITINCVCLYSTSFFSQGSNCCGGVTESKI
jgi:hypothetical protein